MSDFTNKVDEFIIDLTGKKSGLSTNTVVFYERVRCKFDLTLAPISLR